MYIVYRITTDSVVSMGKILGVSLSVLVLLAAGCEYRNKCLIYNVFFIVVGYKILFTHVSIALKKAEPQINQGGWRDLQYIFLQMLH